MTVWWNSETNLCLEPIHLRCVWHLLLQMLHVLFDFLVRHALFFLRRRIAQNPVYRADAWHIAFVADSVTQQVVPDFPRENTRVFLLVCQNLRHHARSSDFWFTTPDGSGSDRACLVISAENFAYTAVGHEQLPRDLRWTDSAVCQLNNSVSHVVGQRSAIDKNTSKLVDSTRSCIEKKLSRILPDF